VGIARAANLCIPLTEAIALAHDCGHGPAGHASEEAFSPFVPGGYDHAWANALGEYIVTDDPNFNPNLGSNSNWEPLSRQ